MSYTQTLHRTEPEPWEPSPTRTSGKRTRNLGNRNGFHGSRPSAAGQEKCPIPRPFIVLNRNLGNQVLPEPAGNEPGTSGKRTRNLGNRNGFHGSRPSAAGQEKCPTGIWRNGFHGSRPSPAGQEKCPIPRPFTVLNRNLGNQVLPEPAGNEPGTSGKRTRNLGNRNGFHGSRPSAAGQEKCPTGIWRNGFHGSRPSPAGQEKSSIPRPFTVLNRNLGNQVLPEPAGNEPGTSGKRTRNLGNRNGFHGSRPSAAGQEKCPTGIWRNGFHGSRPSPAGQEKSSIPRPFTALNRNFVHTWNQVLPERSGNEHGLNGDNKIQRGLNGDKNVLTLTPTFSPRASGRKLGIRAPGGNRAPDKKKPSKSQYSCTRGAHGQKKNIEKSVFLHPGCARGDSSPGPKKNSENLVFAHIIRCCKRILQAKPLQNYVFKYKAR